MKLIAAVLTLAVFFAELIFATVESTELISKSSSGAQGNAISLSASISANGRFVAFASSASNLVDNDVNGLRDIFVRNLKTGQINLVSVNSSGSQSNGASNGPYVSGNGRYVIFWSLATNLGPTDTNSQVDVYLKDTSKGQVTMISTDSNGNQANATTSNARISEDGRYVAFDTNATNLVANDTNSQGDVFIKDTRTGQTTRVSTNSDGNQADNWSDLAGISANGRYVVFISQASNLVSQTTNALWDVFVKDTLTGKTSLVSTDSLGNAGNNTSLFASISADGRYVAFDDLSTNLVAGDNNSQRDVFLKDTKTGSIKLVSVDVNGSQLNGDGRAPRISHDGRYVAFLSKANNLVSGDSANFWDIFVKDMNTGLLERLSNDSAGQAGNNDSTGHSISAYGRYIAIDSDASNLTGGDTNAVRDVFAINKNTKGSKTFAPRRAKAKRKGRRKKTRIRLYWKVTNENTGNQAYVKIKIRKRFFSKAKAKKKARYPYIYRPVKIVDYGLTNINVLRYYTWQTFNGGIFRYEVYARDRYGIVQQNVAKNYVIIL